MSVETVTRPVQIRFPALPRVRAAKPEDFSEIMRLCRLLYAENAAANVDWPAVEAVVIDGVNGLQSCLGVIGKPGGELCGMILLRISRMWYSPDSMLEELFNFVPAEHRKDHNARALVSFAKDCADRLETPMLIGIISNHRTKAKIRLYERTLGPASGAFFLYGAKTGDR